MKDERFDPSDGFGPDDWEYDEDDGFGPDDWEYDEDDGFEDWPDLDEERPAFWEIEEPAH